MFNEKRRKTSPRLENKKIKKRYLTKCLLRAWRDKNFSKSPPSSHQTPCKQFPDFSSEQREVHFRQTAPIFTFTTQNPQKKHLSVHWGSLMLTVCSCFDRSHSFWTGGKMVRYDPQCILNGTQCCSWLPWCCWADWKLWSLGSHRCCDYLLWLVAQHRNEHWLTHWTLTDYYFLSDGDFIPTSTCSKYFIHYWWHLV